jgi:hypothetical protein
MPAPVAWKRPIDRLSSWATSGLGAAPAGPVQRTCFVETRLCSQPRRLASSRRASQSRKSLWRSSRWLCRTFWCDGPVVWAQYRSTNNRSVDDVTSGAEHAPHRCHRICVRSVLNTPKDRWHYNHSTRDSVTHTGGGSRTIRTRNGPGCRRTKAIPVPRQSAHGLRTVIFGEVG